MKIIQLKPEHFNDPKYEQFIEEHYLTDSLELSEIDTFIVEIWDEPYYHFYRDNKNKVFTTECIREEMTFSTVFPLIVALHYELNGLTSFETFEQIWEYFDNERYNEKLLTTW